jgi:hypothetical protein
VVSCPTGSGVMKPRGVRQRAAEEMKMTARAARKLGVVVGFTGSAIWKYVAMFPPATQELVDTGDGSRSSTSSTRETASSAHSTHSGSSSGWPSMLPDRLSTPPSRRRERPRGASTTRSCSSIARASRRSSSRGASSSTPSSRPKKASTCDRASSSELAYERPPRHISANSFCSQA